MSEEKIDSKKGSSKIDDIVSIVEKMTILELADLVKVLEDKFGVSAAASVVAVPAAAAGSPDGVAGASDQGGSDEVDVVLTNAGSQKIQVLKVVRELTGLGLKEAKDLVDGVPKPVKEKVKKEEAEEMKKKLEEKGATVEIK